MRDPLDLPYSERFPVCSRVEGCPARINADLQSAIGIGNSLPDFEKQINNPFVSGSGRGWEQACLNGALAVYQRNSTLAPEYTLRLS